MKEFVKPRVVVSKCLGFESCRYNGQIISSDEVKEMRDQIDFITVCPESDIGLGVPRDPIRLVRDGEDKKLLQPNTGRDVTLEMKDFCANFLKEHWDVDGFILKSRSPSCGLKETKIYAAIDGPAPVDRCAGFFGDAVLKYQPKKAIETEGRLRNYQIRDHFLTKIYTFSSFRDVKKSKDIDKLKEFHDHNRLLLKSYDEEMYEKLCKVFEEDSGIYDIYEEILYELFNMAPECESKIKIMDELFAGLKSHVEEDEIDFFEASLEEYKEGNTSLNVPLSILYTWVLRAKDPELKNQTFFDPYPRELVRLEDVKTCVVRDYWNF